VISTASTLTRKREDEAVGKPLSWKWKLTIAFVVLFFVSLVMVFTDWGTDTMRGWIAAAYAKCQPKERQKSDAADWYLLLAWWEGGPCGREEKAIRMYREFIGIANKDKEREGMRMIIYPYDYEASGFWDEKSKTGWGWTHPRAPEAYYKMLSLFQSNHTAQATTEQAQGYYLLFYAYAINCFGRPHPNFYVHWENVKLMYKNLYPESVPPEAAFSGIPFGG
jgi:hypothetical protein